MFMYVEGRVWSRGGGGGGRGGTKKMTIYNNNGWVTKFKFIGCRDLRVVGIRDYECCKPYDFIFKSVFSRMGFG